MARVFISYRREDSSGWAGRLYDRLSQRFGDENIFMDIDTIDPGLNFVEVIQQAVGSCDVLIALIGPQWLTVSDAPGHRRLDNPNDFVRLEIAAALERNIRVIPVLIQSARMPRSLELPDKIALLSQRNAFEISDLRFHSDVDRLIAVLNRVLRTPIPISPPVEERVSPPQEQPKDEHTQESEHSADILPLTIPAPLPGRILTAIIPASLYDRVLLAIFIWLSWLIIFSVLLAISSPNPSSLLVLGGGSLLLERFPVECTTGIHNGQTSRLRLEA
jgi:hypothetical protein